MMKNTKYNTLIFDFDGTIGDTFSVLLEMVNANKEKFGIDGIDESEIPRLRNLSPKYLLKEFNIHIFQVHKFVGMVQKMLARRINEVRPFDGVPELLKDLKEAGYILGVLTSNSVENVKKFLKNNNITAFDFINSEKHLFGKHKSLKKIMSQRGIKSDAVLYVGDEVRDVEAGEKVAMDVAAVTWGFNSKEILQKHRPTHLIDTVEQIRNLLLP